MPCPNCNEDDAPLGLFLQDTYTDSSYEAPWDYCLKCGWPDDHEERKDNEEADACAGAD